MQISEHRHTYTRVRYYFTAFLLSALLSAESFCGIKVLPPASGAYHAAFPYFGPLEDRVSSSALNSFARLAGKRIAWAYFSNNWFRGIKFPTNAVRIVYRNGAIPFIRLMPRSNFDRDDTVYSLQRIIAGTFDAALTRWAQDAKNLGIPLMLEFAGEPNGDWFPWSGVQNGGASLGGYGDPALPDGPEKYRDAYRHIIDLFRSQGADNITWVFHVNSEGSPLESWNSMKAYYPGDDYIDWIGESAYGAQQFGDPWVFLSDVLEASYDELCDVSALKPLAILEYATIDDRVPGDKAAWIRDGLDSLRAGRYPRIRGLSYWHSRFRTSLGTISNMRLDSSPDVRAAYRAEMTDPYFVSVPQLSAPVPPIVELETMPNENDGFDLAQNFPNPFNPTTMLVFDLPHESHVRLTVYNTLGQEVARLLDNALLGAGAQDVVFDGSTLASGMYFYRLEAVSTTDPARVLSQVKKMMLVK